MSNPCVWLAVLPIYSFSVVNFTCLIQYFPQNRAILVQKLGEKKKWQNPFPTILRPKKGKKKKESCH